jgi:flagellar protein FlaJ
MKLSLGWRIYLALVGPLVAVAFFGLIVIRNGVALNNAFEGLLGAFITGSAIGLLIGGFGYYYEEMKGQTIRLPKVKVKTVKPKAKNSRIEKLSRKLFHGKETDLLKAGISETPANFYYKWTQYFVYSIIASIPASFLLAFMLKSPLPLLIIAFPFLLIFFVPSFQVKNASSERRRGLEDELPFFTIYATVLADAGISMYEAFKRLIGQGIFKWIEKDAIYLVRAVKFLGLDPLTALDSLAHDHPSKEERELIFGYTSELRSGGDVARYLQDKSEELLRWLEFRFEKYGDSVSDIGEMMTALFFILPAMILSTAFISPNTSMTTVWMMNALVIPLLGVVMIFQIRGMQPRTADLYTGNLMLGIIAGAVTVVVLFIAKAPLWALLSAGLVSGSLAYSIQVFVQKRLADEEEHSIAPFLRDVTEYRKSGYTLPRAIEKLANEGNYAESFKSTLKSIHAKLSLGFRLSDFKAGRSWIGRQIFFLLGQIEDTGGGNPREFEAVYRFAERYTFAKRTVRSRMRIYEMLTLFTPVGLALLIFIMSAMFTFLKLPSLSFSGSMVSVSSSSLGAYILLPPQLFTASYVMVVEAGFFMALSSTVAVDFTVKNVWRVALTLILASATIFVLTTFAPALVPHIFHVPFS